MRYSHAAVSQALDQAAEFWNEHRAVLGEVPVLEKLAAVRTDLRSSGAEQYRADMASQAVTRKKDELREQLRREHLIPIRRIVAAGLTDIPVLKMEKFSVPVATATDGEMLVAADAMVAAAQEYYVALRHEGLGEDFIDQLRQATADFRAAIGTGAAERGRRGRETSGLDLRAKHARRVLSVMTAVVEKKFASRPEFVSDWRARVRMPRKPGVPQGTVRTAESGEEVKLKIA